MKKRLLILATLIIAVISILAISASAATYYVDKDGTIVDSTSDKIAFEFDTTIDRGVSYVYTVYLHDTATTKLIFPELTESSTTRFGTWSTHLLIYSIEDKNAETKTDLANQIKEIVFCGNTSFDGANASTGSFMNYKGLEKMTFYKNITFNNSGCLKGVSSMKEMHFYGQNLKVSGAFWNLPTSNVSIYFHEGSSGTISTGGDTLPAASSLPNWKIVINPNITPSNPDDPRLGKKWGSFATTTGWELIVACNPALYTDEELEALKTSHGFCSRFADLASATVKEATVMSYCDALYGGEHKQAEDDASCETALLCARCDYEYKSALSHNFATVFTYVNGFDKVGEKKVDCLNDGCTKDDVATESDPIFKALGYSVPEYDPYSAIYAGYQITDMTLYREYVKAMGEIKFGIAIANSINVGTLVNVDENGEITLSAEKGICATIESDEYSVFKISMMGFNETIAKKLSLVISAYTYADNDNNGEKQISFIQYEMKNEPNTPVNGFNTVTLERAYFNLYPEKKDNE